VSCREAANLRSREEERPKLGYTSQIDFPEVGVATRHPITLQSSSVQRERLILQPPLKDVSLQIRTLPIAVALLV
jgi:hypothetical protein